MVPFLISVPFLIRFRQCLIEYFRVQEGLKTGELDRKKAGWGGQHLANALKYATAFPVTILSALQRAGSSKLGMTDTGLFRLWMIAVFANSFYSFYWDVAKDWDLSLFDALTRSGRQFLEGRRRGGKGAVNGHITNGHASNNLLLLGEEQQYPYGLRQHRYIHAPSVYYVVVGVDLMLRCTWSLKLSPHLDHLNDLEGGIFVMQLLEVFRRWVWIFLRVETEWVRNNRPVEDDDSDVLLGEWER